MRLTRGDAVALGALASGCGFLAAAAEAQAQPWERRLRALSPDLVLGRAGDASEAAAMGAGASYAGARALAAALVGPRGDLGEVLRWAGERRLPLVVLARQDLLSAGAKARVLGGATPSRLFEAVVEAFGAADRELCPIVVDPGEDLGETESVEDIDLEKQIDRGHRIVPAQDAPPQGVGASRVAADGGPLFCVPAVLPLLERPEVAAQAYLPTGRALDLRCAGGRAALQALAAAWSCFSVPVREIVIVSSGCCCPGPAPLGRTFGLPVPEGRAVAAAAGLKLAHPALTAAVIGCAREFAGPGPGLGAFLAAAREGADLLCVMLRRPGESPALDCAQAALDAGASFVARCGASALAPLAAQAAAVRGFSFMDVLSPCGSSPEPEPAVLRCRDRGPRPAGTGALAAAGLLPGRASAIKKALT